MTITDHLIRAEIIRLARHGKLVEVAFKTFQQAVFPGADKTDVQLMRTCFFAGAAEIWALQMYGLDPDQEPTAEDEWLMGAWAAEVEEFHARTMSHTESGLDGGPDE